MVAGGLPLKFGAQTALALLHHPSSINAIQILLLFKEIGLLVYTFNPFFKLTLELVVETSFEVVFYHLFLVLKRLDL